MYELMSSRSLGVTTDRWLLAPFIPLAYGLRKPYDALYRVIGLFTYTIYDTIDTYVVAFDIVYIAVVV